MSTMELDFFGMEKQTASSKSQFQKFLDRRQSFRGIEGAITKIDREIIKSVIASGAVRQKNNIENQFDSSNKSFSVPPTPKEYQNQLPVMSVHVPISRPDAEKVTETAPLTIFYNGTVSVFEVPRHKAESILKLAVGGCSKKVESNVPNVSIPSSDKQKLLQNLEGDLPIARRKSLQRFLEKRKERLTSVSPYSSHT